MSTAIRFTDNSRHMYFGRNYDDDRIYGAHVAITPQGFSAPYAFENDAPVSHAIIGMANVFHGTPMYFDCANEAGLGVAALQFTGYAAYENDAVDGKTNIAAYEFPLWVAATFTSVDEVENALHDVAIVGKPISLAMGLPMYHWMIADVERSIVVEYTSSGMHIYHDSVDTLTSQPTFDWHMENLRNYVNITEEPVPSAKWDTAILHPYGAGLGMRGIPGDPYSPSRFVRAAFLNAHYPEKDTEKDNVNRMFHTLEGVSVVEGSAQTVNHTYQHTLYTSCFSARTQTYYYRTWDDITLHTIPLGEYAHGDSSAVIQPEA